MLLSQENLHVPSNTQHDMEKQKHARIMAFILDQRNRLSGYKSPNHYSQSELDNLPLAEEGGGDNLSLLSASVSQIIPRRRKPNLAPSNRSKRSPSVKSDRRKRKNEESHMKENTHLPQSNSHAFHLLQDYGKNRVKKKWIVSFQQHNRFNPIKSAPNWGYLTRESRLLKQQGQIKYIVPDLVFSEANFLKPDIQASPTSSKASLRQPSISRFFQKPVTATNTTAQKQAVISNKSSKIPSTLASHQTRQRASTAKKSISVIKSSSSNASIERLLKECQEAPQVIIKSNGQPSHDSYDEYNYYCTPPQLPTYPRVKTPTYPRVRTPTNQHPYEEQPQFTPILIESDSETNSYRHPHLKSESVHTDNSLYMFYKDQLNPEHVSEIARKEWDYEDLGDWQIESVASFNSSITNYCDDDNIMNFWQHQFKRTL
ncbi:uncharacterized protein EV154DRAFT_480683 [Mucor mucedo]|uniref:uncharacterized protein n=1 Tax=Mucor mucedo TaxID=29922 RepID=UPI00221E6197|nr:uncharacterized protein EV154DRAFT_480683 [Mucor mucedo]KAI7892075.1 hypothetical protein EV154DRAFT_480683 [Mucor mucedo]